jgi:hypothetical protein
VPVVLQAFSEQRVVLDDAVVNHRDAAMTVQMRMSVAVCGHSMRGPSGVADTDRGRERRLLKVMLQVSHLAGAPEANELAVLDERHPGRIVAAVLQTLQALQEKRRCELRAHVADNSAHPDHPLGSEAQV